jgi:hypothetical protein
MSNGTCKNYYFNLSKENYSFDSVKSAESFIVNIHKPTDSDWCERVYYFIFKFYNNNVNKIRVINDKSEKLIKINIQNWLLKDDEFEESGLIVNRESASQGTDQEGYDDIKFQHSFWGKKYFVFECKILTNTKRSIKNYIYTTYQKNGQIVDDGGVYRFITNKYSANLDFGGMIGFITSNNISDIEDQIKNNLKELKLISQSGKEFGQCLDVNLLKNEINNNKYTFYSKHIRLDKKHDEFIDPIKLTHILLDFS